VLEADLLFCVIHRRYNANECLYDTRQPDNNIALLGERFLDKRNIARVVTHIIAVYFVVPQNAAVHIRERRAVINPVLLQANPL
jgi:hypothetical protein